MPALAYAGMPSAELAYAGGVNDACRHASCGQAAADRNAVEARQVGDECFGPVHPGCSDVGYGDWVEFGAPKSKSMMRK